MEPDLPGEVRHNNVQLRIKHHVISRSKSIPETALETSNAGLLEPLFPAPMDPTQPLSTPSMQPDLSNTSTVPLMQNVGYGGNAMYGGYDLPHPGDSGFGIRKIELALKGPQKDLASVECKSDDVVAVVVTISNGSSYDPLFSSVPQLSPDGLVAVYAMHQSSTQQVLDRLGDSAAPTENTSLEEMMADIAAVEPCSVVFNWECCSGFSDRGFGIAPTVELMGRLLERGFMVMCSDFSVKALIAAWDETRFGPNPFRKVGEFSATCEIRFDTEMLLECPSAQLQKLAELCEDGSAALHAMSGTVAFTADMTIAQSTSEYEFSLLTVASRMDGSPAGDRTNGEGLVKIGDHEGLVGHALLAYPSGGLLLVSCGHWIELTKVNTSEEAVLRAAEKMYGQAYTNEWQANLQQEACPARRSEMLNTYSAQMIQNCTPAGYSKR